MNTEPISNRCPKCHALLPASAPEGLCRKCLLAAVAAPTEAGQPPHAGATVPPPLETVAAAFPQLEILELIGSGGMGVVYKARQPRLDRCVALKLLPHSLAADPAFAERFNREARVLARLNHPGIVTVYDFGDAGGFFFLLMEFVDGVNLRQAMHAGRFTPQQAFGLVPKICEALQFAHDEGILHRDIKPENILLDSKGRVKNADFGIAKMVGERRPVTKLTATGAAIGTPNYMAPEQLEHPEDVDQRADIYSIGVVFYEMLTGELPIGRFAPPSQKTSMDERVDEIVLKALARERELRQQSANEVKTQVEGLQTPRSARSQPVSPEPAMTAAPPAQSAIPSANAAKSRKVVAAAGLVCASLVSGVLLALLACAVQFHWWGVAGGGVGATISLVLLTLALGLPGTLIGAMAVSEMRKAGDDRGGWPVALFAALCWPTLLLDGLLAVLIDVLLDSFHFSPNPEAVLLLSVTLSTLLTAALVLVAMRFFWSRSAGSTPQTIRAVRVSASEGWSRLAIWGAALTGSSLPFPLLVLLAGLLGMGGIGAGELWITIGCLVFLGMPGTLLGWMALSQIRRSHGQLQGLPLALFAALTWPLLVSFLGTLLPPLMIATPNPVWWGPALLLLPIVVLVLGIWAVRATARWGSSSATIEKAPRTIEELGTSVENIATTTGLPPVVTGPSATKESVASPASPDWQGVWLGLSARTRLFAKAAMIVLAIAVAYYLWSLMQARTSKVSSPPLLSSEQSLSVDISAPPRETLVITGIVLSNNVPVSSRELRAKLSPPSGRKPSPFVVRWQTIKDGSAATPWEIVVEDKTSDTIAARLRPVNLPQLAWTSSPQAERTARKSVTHEAWAFEVARALQATGGGNTGAADWSVRLQLQSAPLQASTSKRGIDADFVLPAHQVAVFEVVTRSSGVVVPVPELATYVINGADGPYVGKFLWADDPEDLDSLTALPRWKFGIIGPDGKNLHQGLGVPAAPAGYAGSTVLWTALKPDTELIEGLADSASSRPAYGLRIRTHAVKTAPGQTYRSIGQGTNWIGGAASPGTPTGL
ncbi:MAG: serine/threonine-protein kinase [Verrucomicrobia bacterium]|nr:serine/threonine-protein kinase [Verrucomicrobiota bacterium]